MIHAFGAAVKRFQPPVWSFEMRNTHPRRVSTEVTDKVEFTPRKSMKSGDLARPGMAFSVFLTETDVPCWKRVAHVRAEAYDSRNVSPILEV
jgi:hypothetical protein